MRNPRGDQDPRLARLTPTELRIVEMIAEGLTNRQIGVRIHLAEMTVKNYVSTILSKLQVSRRAEAAAYFAQRQNTTSGGSSSASALGALLGLPIGRPVF